MESTEEFIRRKRTQIERDIQNRKIVRFKEVGKGGRFGFRREAVTLMPQHNLKTKVLMIERLSRAITGEETLILHPPLVEGDVEYRIGYWIVGKSGWAAKRWVWGQFCPLVPAKDFQHLLKKR